MTEASNLAPTVLVFSGGQDSTTCLIHLLQQQPAEQIHCLTFDYGQRHRSEIAAAYSLSSRFGVIHHRTIDISFLSQLADSSLTNSDLSLPQQVEGGIPTTFVPGRNILFLNLAMIYAYQHRARRVVTGVCQVDFSGYPDCRDTFVKAFNHGVNLGLGRNIPIETPLMFLNKAEIWALADCYGHSELVSHESVTCYHGVVGSGCGNCASCHLRQCGLQRYLAEPKATKESLRGKILLP